MSSNINQYFALSELDRKLLKRACKGMDDTQARQLVQLYFPKIHHKDVAAFIKQIGNLVA